MDIDDVMQEELDWLLSRENATQNELLRIYQDTLQEISERVDALPEGSFTRQHLQAVEAQLDVLMSEMYNRQRDVLAEDVQQTYRESLYRGQDTWIRMERFFGQASVAEQFSSIVPVVPQRAVQALLQVSSVSMTGFSSTAAASMRTTLAQSLILGEGTQTAARRLRNEGYNSSQRHLNLIARMELSRAQNEAKSDLIEQFNEKHPSLDLWQLIRDRIDRSPQTRNHFFSWAIHNTVRNVTAKEYFEVSMAAVMSARAEWSRTTRRKLPVKGSGGIVWGEMSGGRGYHGKSVPSHYNDRAVLLPWRPAWGISMIGGGVGVKHPQGPIIADLNKNDLQMGNYSLSSVAEVKDVSKRHYLNGMSHIKNKNTMVFLPSDSAKETIKSEISDIRSGLARRIRIDPPLFEVSSGRVYGYHQNDQKKNTFHPEYGPDLVNLNRREYAALRDAAEVMKRGTPEEKLQNLRQILRGWHGKRRANENQPDIGLTQEDFESVKEIMRTQFGVIMEDNEVSYV